jgi:hypothetical protein
MSSTARAQSPPELRCQEILAKSAREYVKSVHRVRTQCENAILNGGACDGAEDASRIAAAFAKLERDVTLRCTDTDLATLGFPGQCTDAGGPPFTVADLAACIRDTHSARIQVMIAVEYPDPPGPVERTTAHCNEHIGRSVGLVDRHAKARQKCLNLKNLGRLPPGVDCLDNSDPFATGDAKTDQALVKGSNWSMMNLTQPCQNKTLEDLGFPGNCTDSDGSPFTIADLIACIEETHSALTLELIEIEYALGP